MCGPPRQANTSDTRRARQAASFTIFVKFSQKISLMLSASGMAGTRAGTDPPPIPNSVPEPELQPRQPWYAHCIPHPFTGFIPLFLLPTHNLWTLRLVQRRLRVQFELWKSRNLRLDAETPVPHLILLHQSVRNTSTSLLRRSMSKRRTSLPLPNNYVLIDSAGIHTRTRRSSRKARKLRGSRYAVLSKLLCRGWAGFGIKYRSLFGIGMCKMSAERISVSFFSLGP